MANKKEKPIIAIPKGRLLHEVANLFDKAGIIQREKLLKTRKLLFELPDVNPVLLKSKDILKLIQMGEVDAGILGKDIIKESEFPLKEWIDLHIGKCRICLCGKRDLDFQDIKVVCTSYPNIAKDYLKIKGWAANVVKLEGSVEVAPLMGYADCIVEIVDSGRTLVENGLYVYEEIMQVSARLVTAQNCSIEETGIKGIYDKLSECLVNAVRG